MPMQVPGYHTNTPLDPSFDKDTRDLHLVYDYDVKEEDGQKQMITTMCAFSKGHWEHSEEAHGDKRNPGDFARCAKILENFRGPGDLVPIASDAETL
ncbi:hypothetical protein PHYSODRAFT_324383 [Phytophthora sojae]|uniref:Uncharacterized protein n=1 Tax=Phytophthora sojae (strain P6497) TaxID=1094619 RepID=G4YUX2_PHYSP|nr:hypothetical protein PHYSODRAFT_324383 [Phytophthora sojae]EGZ23138.1 hypothetical protein PHYSODRAFT_324383 [Phytophthora sojae]|eukprot:XP_009518426.1 hypothetical protein PHYSODRAFT_324383 [Phytophthora sojae]